LGNQTKKGDVGGSCSTYRGKKNAFRLLLGKPEAKRQLGRRRRRWEENFIMNLKIIGLESVDWIKMAELTKMGGGGAGEHTTMKLRVA
jgi:hypothetical protein